jgi:hypothetical protein
MGLLEKKTDVKTRFAGLAQKIDSAKYKFRFLFQGDIKQFLREIAKLFPYWIFRFNSGTIMVTSSPKVIARNYKSYLSFRADSDDIPEIARLTGLLEPYLYNRLKGGDRCYIIRDLNFDNRIVNVFWGHRGACHIRGFGINLDIGDDSVYLFGAYTLPEVRIKGVFNTTFKDLYESYKQENVSRFYGLVEHENRYSYNIHIRLNFKPAGSVVFIAILFFRMSFYKNLESGKRKFMFFISDPPNKIVI